MTADEIELEIAEITVALSHIRKAGQSYTIISASGAGTQRTVTMADYDSLVEDRQRLKVELKGLLGKKATRIGAGW